MKDMDFIDDLLKRVSRMRHDILMEEPCPIYDADENDWEDMESESEYAGLSINDIVEAMQSLSPSYQTVFNLYVMEGYTHQEIADELEINIGTSKSNLAKAKANMKTMLTDKLNRL